MSTSVQHDVILTDEKGKVIGMEKRTFLLVEEVGGGRSVYEKGGVASAEDSAAAKRFAEQITTKRGKQAVLDLACRTHKELEGLRVAWRDAHKETLSTFIRTHLGASVLANLAISLLASPAEFCADELHTGCMGLNDNQGAVYDVVGASSPQFLAQVNAVYGIKYGDGRYEKKSADGKGDPDRMIKDVLAAVQANGADHVAKIKALWTARVHFEKNRASVNPSSEHGDLAGFVQFLSHASVSDCAHFVDTLQGGAPQVAQHCAKIAGGDMKLQMALQSVALSGHPQLYWLDRLQSCNSGYSFNKKLFLRIACLNEPQERVKLAKAYASVSPAGGLQPLLDDPSFKEDEKDIIRALFQLK